jgi:hypothetical protein
MALVSHVEATIGLFENDSSTHPQKKNDFSTPRH